MRRSGSYEEREPCFEPVLPQIHGDVWVCRRCGDVRKNHLILFREGGDGWPLHGREFAFCPNDHRVKTDIMMLLELEGRSTGLEST